MFIKLSPYLIAMAIGLMVGIDRERKGRADAPTSMGVRTFILFGLLGGLAGDVGEPLISLGLLLFASSATLIGYFRTSHISKESKHGFGLTTEIAAMITFGLGYFANFEPFLSLFLGVVMFLVVLNKSFLHTLVKRKLKPNEIQAAATLLFLAVGIIPLIPDKPIDPLGIFNPRTLAIIIALVAGIQFVGYAASKIFGKRLGLPLSGFLAGNVSSTIAFLSYPRFAKMYPENIYSISAAATFATLATIFQIIILVGAVSIRLVLSLAIPLLSLLLVCLAIGFYFYKFDHEIKKETQEQENPLSILSAIKLGILLTALIFIVELSQRFLGDTFTKVITFLGALFELHGVAIASANMYVNNTVSISFASQAILLAIIASLISKFFLTLIIARGKYQKVMLSVIGGLLSLSVLFWIFYKFFPHIFIDIFM